MRYRRVSPGPARGGFALRGGDSGDVACDYFREGRSHCPAERLVRVFAIRPLRVRRPPTPALPPEYRGEGVRGGGGSRARAEGEAAGEHEGGFDEDGDGVGEVVVPGDAAAAGGAAGEDVGGDEGHRQRQHLADQDGQRVGGEVVAL